ncbi:MAG: ATP-dependent helicase [Bacteroidaceae bacterium]|nr:ATP-dependent helicase [Bacteroidaceae bacterium]
MLLDKYEQLSEDAQRLLCYYAEAGLGTSKRMEEHLYILRQYAFPTFNGQAALDELTRLGILTNQGRDWYANAPRYGLSTDDFVPALWYLYECRKDLLPTIQHISQARSQTYLFVRYAVKQLVDNAYQACPSANVIGADQAHLFYCVASEMKFQHLFENFQPTTFTAFYSNVCDYFIANDIVADTTLILTEITSYNTITEATRCRLLAEVELYEYIATGQMPGKGAFDKIAAGYALHALHTLCEGKHLDAARWFDIATKTKEKENNSKTTPYGFFLSFYTALAFMAVVNDGGKGQEKAVEVCRKKLHEMATSLHIKTDQRMLPVRVLTEDFCHISTTLHKELVQKMYDGVSDGTFPRLFRPLAFLLANYLGYSTASMDINLCMPNLALLQHEMAKYLPLYEQEQESLRQRFGNHPTLANIYHKAEWESVLEGLMDNAEGKTYTPETQDTRIMYIRDSMSTRTIQVREQSRLKDGTWGNGKRLSDTRYRTGDLPFMNNADRRILARLTHSQHWELQLEDVIEEMVEDSRLYLGRNAPFELIHVHHDKPYLIIEHEGDHFAVRSNVPANHAKDDLIIVEDSPTEYSLINIPDEVRGYYVKLLQLGNLPLEAEPTLRNLMAKIGGQVELHSSLIEGGSTLPIIDGQWATGFKLSPKQGGNWEVESFVRPLPGGRRTYRLCEGDEVIIDENEQNGRTRVKRNMEMERSSLELVRAFWKSQGYDYEEKVVYPPEFMLELLQLIQEHPDSFYAEWPERQGFKIRTLTRGAGSWNGVLKQRGQWFDIEGEVNIDENTRISISELLELVGKSKGKYIRLSDGEFLALSEKLRLQLKALDAIANRERGKIHISPFSAALMGDDLLHGDLELHMDKELQSIRQRILDGSNYTPAVPAELNATLRPYQKDGYLWIARLNSWGAGALLADDMGLGKTIQTIAFLLLKKDEGPSLVVAPASVAPNWKTEIERFAPTLNVQILNFAANRRQVVNEATAGDIIVTTYGILLSIQDCLTKKHWNVACLDEAHIIKNRGAKASAAAMKIQADNRVMLTGTPVQNHLGELWNLFQFVNPGLLGNYEHFSQKFIVPIEGYQDQEKQEQLERIVHPFMLRRTKQAVLKELPEKTEIYHPVELSHDELAIYESIRVRAEKMLQEGGLDVDMHVLAEITRLRQAACSAQLIEPKWTGECSKVTTLVELLQGVIEGGNRALVFSQFVSFFDIVRKELDRLGMKYFYIDGSTPLKQRTEMVDAFQNGENPLFLISLKAGGLGLNLTGANYVFHLDPWWNPAVEQQATDRAYRIGQQQAVTVYHLVSKNTIEEKIIRLHQTKRDLAENILAGTDTSYKLTGKDLLEMVAR